MEQNFNEKESLELISRMIQATKEDMDGGSINPLLAYGIAVPAVGIVTWLLVRATGNPMWNFAWFSMFVFWAAYATIRKRRSPAKVVSYSSYAIESIWAVLGTLFAMTPVFFAIVCFAKGGESWRLMSLIAPMCMIYTGIGVAFTGIVLKEKIVTFIPIVAMLSPLYMFAALSNRAMGFDAFMLQTIVTFIVTMLVPGLYLNIKNRK